MKKKATIWALVLILPLWAAYTSGVNERLIGVSEADVLPVYESEAEETGPDITEILYSVGNVYSFLEQNFLYEIDSRKMEESLISGLVSGLGDKYSYYVTEEKLQEYTEEVIGEYVGIGTYVSKMNPIMADPNDPETYMLQIVSPFPGGPADRAGLMPGDLINRINGEDLSQLNAQDAARKLRGKLGEPLTLDVLRGKTFFEISVIPENVIEPSTAYTMLDGNIGYLAIKTFQDQTDEAVKEALETMLSEGMEKLIIDLRFNGGGLVDSCLTILDYVLPKDSIMISIEYSEKSGRPGITYKTTGNPVIPDDMPMAVLINDGSASASEIMTGAIRDNDRAVLIGEKSFGKGIIQQQIPYKGGAINITLAKYLTPSGDEIHEKGIMPDIEVKMPEYDEDVTLAYFDLSDTHAHKTWVDEHPGLTDGNVEAFCTEYADTGVPHELLYSLVKKEYIYRMPAAERPIVDLEQDIQLQRAIEELSK